MFCVPIVAANMGTVGTVNMARRLSIEGYMCALEKHIPEADILELFRMLDEGQRNRVLVSIGVKESLDGIQFLIGNGFDQLNVNIDVPNGYIPKLKTRVEEIRALAPKAFIVAGTVVTADAAQDLILAGANCVRCGIGCGSVCATRVKSGVGCQRMPPDERLLYVRWRSEDPRRCLQGVLRWRGFRDDRFAPCRMRRSGGRDQVHQRQEVQVVLRHVLPACAREAFQRNGSLPRIGGTGEVDSVYGAAQGHD